ncbi:hypothetical protein SARC_00018 [Sphaeroforma arctica JP610]|uniref:Ysc84 actin-binding domain-containing protein n=1 Tax=Sphaeroforma arctica JP610 TaxID=667725 RepID=A0A0L0GG86_9EUKA|nr:hypothetical protein SARC_00018 [Sphaeroforma arctica JP610]KNC87884.1 hypothetical protein SARC_00018 [Sphaeroforma arctica JP610]|eukprot:XP_014161786.1 hypothetical protein SARC_00018 [Sphaeroforma arctica JP610]
MRHPFPCNLRKECDHASAILESGSVKDTKSKVKSVLNTIPPKLFRSCKGVAIATLAQMSILLGGVKGGSGVVLKHDPKTDEWSDPIGFGLAGGLFGFQLGIAAIDLVMILTTDNAVKAFARGNVTLGGEIGCAIGPHGRTLEGDIAIMNISPVVTYSFSRGLLFSMSVEGVGIIQRPDSNKKFYGQDVDTMDVLNGFKDLQPVKPQGATAIRRLHKCLQMRGMGETFKDDRGSLSPENVPPSRPQTGATAKPRSNSYSGKTGTAPAASTGYVTNATKNTGGYEKSTYTAKAYGKKSPEPPRARTPPAPAAATGYAASSYKSSGYGSNNTEKSTYTSSGYGSNKQSSPASTYTSSGYKSPSAPSAPRAPPPTTTYTPPATSIYSGGGGYNSSSTYNSTSIYDRKPACNSSTSSSNRR